MPDRPDADIEYKHTSGPHEHPEVGMIVTFSKGDLRWSTRVLAAQPEECGFDTADEMPDWIDAGTFVSWGWPS
jgi:hypothetical protein